MCNKLVENSGPNVGSEDATPRPRLVQHRRDMPATAYAAEGRVGDHKPLYRHKISSMEVGAFSFVVGRPRDSDGGGGRCLQVLGSACLLTLIRRL